MHDCCWGSEGSEGQLQHPHHRQPILPGVTTIKSDQTRCRCGQCENSHKFATCGWRIGVQKCAQVPGSSTLGKLGRYREKGSQRPSCKRWTCVMRRLTCKPSTEVVRAWWPLPPTWEGWVETAHPPNVAGGEPQPRVGWQAQAARSVESSFLANLSEVDFARRRRRDAQVPKSRRRNEARCPERWE